MFVNDKSVDFIYNKKIDQRLSYIDGTVSAAFKYHKFLKLYKFLYSKKKFIASNV